MTDNVAAGARRHSEPIDCRGVPLDGAAGITKSDLTFEEALMIRKAKAVWHGTGRAGNGNLSTDSSVLRSDTQS